MRFLRPLLFFALVWLTLLIFIEAQEEYRREKPDQSKLVLYFGSLVLVGGVAGVAFVKIVLPMLGDALGNVFSIRISRSKNHPTQMRWRQWPEEITKKPSMRI